MDSKILVVGRFQNAVQPNNALPNGQTELVFDDLIVPHPAVKGQNVLILPRHNTSKEKFIIDLEISNGKLEAIQGTPLDGKGEIERYIRGGVALRDRTTLG